MVRHVRTPEGVRHFGQPIGSIIEADIPKMGDVQYDDSNPPPYLYRAVSEEDWAGIQSRGSMQSDGRMNVVDTEGTVAADRDPSFYLPLGIGAMGRILRIKFNPEDGWHKDNDSYWKTPKKIPLDRIDATTPPRIDQYDPDEYTYSRLLHNASNRVSNAVNDVPGWQGRGPVGLFRDESFDHYRSIPREGGTAEDIDTYIAGLESALDHAKADVQNEWEQREYDDLEKRIRKLLGNLKDAKARMQAHEQGVLFEKVIRHVRDVAYWGKPYGTVITPGMKPAGGPRIKYRTSDVYEGTEGIYSSQSSTFEIRLPGEHTIAGTTYPNTEPLPGKPISRDELPRTVYHVSVNAPAVRDSGVLLMMDADNSAGLGGAHRNTVSLTTDRAVALQLADDMKLYAELAQTGDIDLVLGILREEFDKREMTGFDDVVRNAEVNGQNPHETFGSIYNNVMSLYFSKRATQNKGRNPIIFGGVWKEDSMWWSVKPENVGVIDIPVADIPRDALIVDFDRGRDFGLEEVRVYADIPIPKRREYPRVRIDTTDNSLTLNDALGSDTLRIPRPTAPDSTPNPLDIDVKAAHKPLEYMDTDPSLLEAILDGPNVTRTPADKLKASINEQLTARIYDHMLADPELKEWAGTYVDKRRAVSALSSIPTSFIGDPWLDAGRPLSGKERDACRKELTKIGLVGPIADSLMDFDYNTIYDSAADEDWRIGQRYANARGLFNGYQMDDDGNRLTYYNFLEEYENVYGGFTDEELQIRFYTQSAINTWAKSSGDNNEESVFMQHTAHELFGVGDVSHLPMYRADPNSDVQARAPFYRAFLQSTYEQTQQLLEENGIDHVRAYRGMKWDVDSALGIPEWAVEPGIDKSLINSDLRDRMESQLFDAVVIHEDEYRKERAVEKSNSMLADAYDDPSMAEVIDSFDDISAFSIWYRNYALTQLIPEDSQWQAELNEQWEYEEDFFREKKEREYVKNLKAEFVRHRPLSISSAGMSPLSSWSTSAPQAGSFAEGDGDRDYGFVIGASVPRERVFSSTLTGLGCLNETELVVLAGDSDDIGVLWQDDEDFGELV